MGGKGKNVGELGLTEKGTGWEENKKENSLSEGASCRNKRTRNSRTKISVRGEPPKENHQKKQKPVPRKKGPMFWWETRVQPRLGTAKEKKKKGPRKSPS